MITYEWFCKGVRPVALSCLLATQVLASDPVSFSLHVEDVQSRGDRHRLLGTNLAMWHEPEDLFNPKTLRAIQAIQPTFLRIPGGSWSNEIYWNGHGVRNKDGFDHSKRVDGIWQVDYSDYAPGFRVHTLDGELADYHGVVDVKGLQDKVKSMGSTTVISVNAGTGTPTMAAEWVRWANQTEDYDISYWEVGNELEGSWELGHLKADGTPMTGKDYAEKFTAFATAMKAVDPSIKMGGPVASNLNGGYMEDLLKYAGEHVDFVSFHTYPVGKGHGDEAAYFKALSKLEPALKKYRRWIATYQPDRKDEIEIALTEWNSKVFEDRDTGDLLNGLWTAGWIGEMLKGDISFATQWDLMTRTKTGGHGLMARVKDNWVPTSQYWATWLWAHHMGNDLIPVTFETTPDLLHLVATQDERGIHIMAVNFQRESGQTLNLPDQLATWKGAKTSTTLSHASYFWDYIHHHPLWSAAPETKRMKLGSTVTLPPYSATVFSFLHATSATTLRPLPEEQPRPGTQLFLPKTCPADLPIEGWLFVDSTRDKGKLPLTVTGPATADRSEIRFEQGAGRFFLTPTGAGKVTVAIGELSKTIKIKPVEARDVVLWPFEKEPSFWNMKSAFSLSADESERPNQGVARIDLDHAQAAPGKDSLLETTSLPESLTPSRIGGVVVDLKLGPFQEAIPEGTTVHVVLQSKADHWIPLGGISIRDISTDWETFRFPLPEPDMIPLMQGTYSLRLQLQQLQEQRGPVTFTLFVDNLGFLYR